MNKIAIIDTAIDIKSIRKKNIHYIDLCGGNAHNTARSIGNEISHGTLCAMVLDHCALDYELINIRIFDKNKEKVYSKVERLAEALTLCHELGVNIVSLSAVSSILSDSKQLYDITRKLSEITFIVSALDNAQYITVPTSYPHVIGVQHDFAGLLLPGEIAACKDNPFGIDIYANCDFNFLREYDCALSNSLAVPIVAAHINNLLNNGSSKDEAEHLLRNLKLYPFDNGFYKRYLLGKRLDRDIPVIFLSDASNDVCRELMDSFFEKFDVQASALSDFEGNDDIRIQPIENSDNIQNELRFMENHYKTDLIFIVASEQVLLEIRDKIDIDIELFRQKEDKVLIRHEYGEVIIPNSKLADTVYELLTAQGGTK